MRILVTGAGGLIGARVAAFAEAAGHEVIRLVRRGSGDVVHDLRYPLGDIPRCEAVFHLAGAYAGGSYRKLKHRDLVMAQNLIAWGVPRGVRAWVIASAAEAYGRVEGLATEQSPCAPVIAYGRVKVELEAMFAALPAERTVCLRIGEVYGPGSKLLGELTARLRSGFCPWPGNGRVPVSFVHADDVARAFLDALARAPAGTSTYNVADGTPATWRRFLGLVAELTNTRPPVYLPLFAARAYAYAASTAAVLTRREPVLSPNIVTLLTTPKALSTVQIVQELGTVPHYPDIRSGLEACFGLSHNTQDGRTQRAAAGAST